MGNCFSTHDSETSIPGNEHHRLQAESGAGRSLSTNSERFILAKLDASRDHGLSGPWDAAESTSKRTSTSPAQHHENAHLGTNLQSSNLCQDCEKIDFYSMNYFGETKEYVNFTVGQAVQKSIQCAFCKMILETAEDRFGPLSQPVIFALQCRVAIWWTVYEPWQDFGNHHSTRHCRISLSIRHVCKDEVRLNRKSCSLRSRFGRKEEILILDRVGPPPNHMYESEMMIAARRPMKKRLDTNLLLSWLAEADSKHSNPEFADSLSRSVSLPALLATERFRVIDVHSRTVISLETPVRYLALSYVWGKEGHGSHSRTGMTRAVNSSRQINWALIPPTIQDAASLVLNLNERYLWVDALCINQDDSVDKDVIISRMSAIYANAYITIVAADGYNADHGLTGLSRSRGEDEVPITFETKRGQVSLLPRRLGLSTIVDISPWSTRGWTFQERLLSRRCVFFTEEQVYFQGGAFIAEEAYDLQSIAGSNNTKIVAMNQDSKNQKQWAVGDLYMRMNQIKTLRYHEYRTAVSEYTKRKLSHYGDRMDAFIGISERFQPTDTSGDALMALCGLPIDHFTSALCWDFSHRGTSSFAADDGMRLAYDARRTRHLPSWSWVGWTGQIFIPDILSNDRTSTTRVVDARNVICGISKLPGNFQPELCEDADVPPVCLHIWAPVAQCRFPLKQPESDTQNTIHFLPLDESVDILQVQTYGNVFLNDGSDPDEEYEAVAIGQRKGDMIQNVLILRRKGEFKERVGRINFPPGTDFDSYFEDIYVRVI